MQPRLTKVHSDHAKYIPQYLKYGIPIYSCADVASKYPKVNPLESMKKYKIGNFEVMALPVPHSVENYAYYIAHPSCGKMLFATDMSCFKYNIRGLHHIFIECNYIQDLLVSHYCNGDDVRSQSNNHMELDLCIETIRSLYSHHLMTVVLLHLSDSNSDVNIITERFRTELGILPIIAKKNIEVALKFDDF